MGFDANVKRSIKTEFDTPFSSIVTVLGEISMIMNGTTLEDIGLLHDSVSSLSSAVVVIAGRLM